MPEGPPGLAAGVVLAAGPDEAHTGLTIASLESFMATHDRSAPDRLPVLSRGKHRSPTRGACLMELVSYLAGEPWSDHPACTHPLLAAVARSVNDHTPDEVRPRLALLIPSLIGLNDDDPQLDARIALRCATTALPVVAAERQRVMAVAVLVCEGVLDDLDGGLPESLEEASRLALEDAPHAAQWARHFTSNHRNSLPGFRRHGAPSIVENAVKGIAGACIPDPPRLLHDLLVMTISECSAWIRREGTEVMVGPAQWDEVCALTGSRGGH